MPELTKKNYWNPSRLGLVILNFVNPNIVNFSKVSTSLSEGHLYQSFWLRKEPMKCKCGLSVRQWVCLSASKPCLLYNSSKGFLRVPKSTQDFLECKGNLRGNFGES